MGQTSVYSTDPVISVGTDNTGQFLCTAVNSVGPSLTASLVVEIRGEVVIVILGSSLFIYPLDLPRRLQLEVADYRSSVRLHFPIN